MCTPCTSSAARDLGFSIEEITTLLALWHDRSRTSAQVKRIAQSHIDQLTQRIAAMQAMQRTLQTLVGCCQGDDRPDCPILDDLAGAGWVHGVTSRHAEQIAIK